MVKKQIENCKIDCSLNFSEVHTYEMLTVMMKKIKKMKMMKKKMKKMRRIKEMKKGGVIDEKES